MIDEKSMGEMSAQGVVVALKALAQRDILMQKYLAEHQEGYEPGGPLEWVELMEMIPDELIHSWFEVLEILTAVGLTLMVADVLKDHEKFHGRGSADEMPEPTGLAHARKVAEAVGRGEDPRTVVTDDPTGDKDRWGQSLPEAPREN